MPYFGLPNNDPFFVTTFAVPSNGSWKDFGTETTLLEQEVPEGARSKERFNDLPGPKRHALKTPDCL
jgi:hypothetical protein